MTPLLQRYRHLSLYHQLLIPLLVVGVLGFGAVFLSAMVLQKSVDELEAMFGASSERLEVLQAMDKDIAVYRALSLKHIASEGAGTMAGVGAELDKARSRIEAYLWNLSEQGHHAGANGWDQQMGVLQKEIFLHFTSVDAAIRLSSDFEKESAFARLTRAEGEHLSTIQYAMQLLTRHAFEDIAASRAQVMTAAKRNGLISVAIGIFGGILLLVIAFLVTRRFSRRIAGLLGWSQRIAAGDLSNAGPADSRDEVGQLTNAMRGMVASIERGHAALEYAKQDAEAVAEELRLYANAFENSGEPMLITDRENRIVNVNAAFTELTGYTLDEVRGRDPKLLSSGKTPQAVYVTMWHSLLHDGVWRGELWDRKKSGEIYPKWTSISTIRDAKREVVLFYVASFSDISERKANEARIDYLAHHDALTGLINRYNLENRLGQVVASAQREKCGAAVMFIDMDRFKSINDTLGHHCGDLLLIEIAQRLRTAVRDSDIVARLGGDEFVVVLTGMVNDMDVAPVAEKILRLLGEPYQIEGIELHSSPSIGIAVCPGDGVDGQTLMRNADTAMYHAKERGRNNVQYFTPAMNAAASERLALENDLRQALREGQLDLHYQPQVCAADGRVVGVEALARWQHPVSGNIPPLKFIPIAEESGLIEPLGNWVLDEACRQIAAWRADGIARLRVAVNLSAKQLRSPDLVSCVAATLKRHGLDGDDLELEITESVAMENPERAIAQLQALRELGIHLAIDDFGTGYSSLAYLKRLPIQVLKLDRTFVRDIETDASDAEISAATLALAHNLGLQVVAEGVETDAQRVFLTKEGCDFLQGYLFSKPLPAVEVLPLLRQGWP